MTKVKLRHDKCKKEFTFREPLGTYKGKTIYCPHCRKNHGKTKYEQLEEIPDSPSDIQSEEATKTDAPVTGPTGSKLAKESPQDEPIELENTFKNMLKDVGVRGKRDTITRLFFSGDVTDLRALNDLLVTAGLGTPSRKLMLLSWARQVDPELPENINVDDVLHGRGGKRNVGGTTKRSGLRPIINKNTGVVTYVPQEGADFEQIAAAEKINELFTKEKGEDKTMEVLKVLKEVGMIDKDKSKERNTSEEVVTMVRAMKEMNAPQESPYMKLIEMREMETSKRLEMAEQRNSALIDEMRRQNQETMLRMQEMQSKDQTQQTELIAKLAETREGFLVQEIQRAQSAYKSPEDSVAEFINKINQARALGLVKEDTTVGDKQLDTQIKMIEKSGDLAGKAMEKIDSALDKFDNRLAQREILQTRTHHMTRGPSGPMEPVPREQQERQAEEIGRNLERADKLRLLKQELEEEE